MFHLALFKGNRPVWRIITYRCRYMEAFRQFGINNYFARNIEALHELPLIALLGSAIGKHIVLNTLLSLESLIHRGMLLLSKNGTVIFSIHLIVSDMIYYHSRFLLQYQSSNLGDKLFRIQLKHIKLHRTDFRQNSGYRFTSKR